MSRPRNTRNALVKCLPCGAPTTLTADGGCLCVECGRELWSGKKDITTPSEND